MSKKTDDKVRARQSRDCRRLITGNLADVSNLSLSKLELIILILALSWISGLLLRCSFEKPIEPTQMQIKHTSRMLPNERLSSHCEMEWAA